MDTLMVVISLLAVLVFMALGGLYYVHAQANNHELILRKLVNDVKAIVERPYIAMAYKQPQGGAPQFSQQAPITIADEDESESDSDADPYAVAVESSDSDSDVDAGDVAVETESFQVADHFPVVDESVAAAEPASEPVVDTPAAEPAAEPATEPATEPAVEDKKRTPSEPAKNYEVGHTTDVDGQSFVVSADKNGRKRWVKSKAAAAVMDLD